MVPARGAARLWCALLCSLVLGGRGLAEELVAPLSLSDPDGQDLVLERMDVRLAAHGPLALTELELRFRNPASRQVEGRFTCDLPPGATVSRFAKEVDGRLMEGEVVERLKAKRVYTEILHTMRDPALLEQDQGNRFQARIFPIPAGGAVRLLLSFTSLHPARTDGTREITLPLRGLREIGEFRFHGIVRTLPGEVVTAEGWLGSARRQVRGPQVVFSDEDVRTRFTPREDLRLRFSAGAEAPRQNQMRAGEYRMITLRPQLAAGSSAEAIREWVVYVDTSASQADSPGPRLEALRALLAGLEGAEPGASVRLLAFDLEVRELAHWRAGDGGLAAAMKMLAARHFVGASDVGRALDHLAMQARLGKGSGRCFVLASDLVPSMGARTAEELTRRLEGFPTSARLHVVTVGTLTEERISRAVADKGRGRVVALPLTTTYQEHASRAVEALRRPPGASFTVEAPGATWVKPDFFEDVRDGEELVAFVRGGSAPVRFLRLGGEAVGVTATAVEVPDFGPLLERQAQKAWLAHLEREEVRTEDPAARRRLREQQLEISLKYRVLCPLTSMLVLESEADYRRFDIDRRALTDVMVLGTSGIELLKRVTPDLPLPDPPAPEPRPMPPLRDHGRQISSLAGDRERGGTPPGALEQFGQETGEAEGTFEDAMDTKEESWDGVVAAKRAVAFSRDLDGGGPGSAPVGGMATEMSLNGGSGGGGSSAPPDPMRPTRVRPAATYRPPMPLGDAVGMSQPSLGSRRPSANLVPDEANVEEDDGDDGDDEDDSFEAGEGDPSWVSQANWRPDERLLRGLRKRVEAAPRDRGHRNALAWSLMKVADWEGLRDQALDWQPYDTRNPMVYEYLGVALDNLGDDAGALRAFSSIAEISPGDSGLLNRAGFLCLRAGEPEMARTLFEFAIERRPEHQNNYRGLALTLWTQARHREAVEVYRKALAQDFDDRYHDVGRILREEAAYVLRAWRQAEASASGEVTRMARELGADLERRDDLRVTLHWENDANDVDLHVVDPRGEESYYSNKRTRSGLELYEDLTEGLGPECTVVPRGRRLPGAYHVGVKYFAAGPMGVSRGVVVLLRPSAAPAPDVTILPFTLLPDVAGRAQDMRHLAVEE